MNYPLLLRYQGATIGTGFVADVTMTAKVLATVEADGVWLNGVQPGAMAAGGDTVEQAHLKLRESLRLLMVDFATESANFDEFRLNVESFFNQTDVETMAEWDDALVAVRALRTGALGLPEWKAEDHQPIVMVTLRRTVELLPTMNVPAFECAPTAVESAANQQLAAAA